MKKILMILGLVILGLVVYRNIDNDVNVVLQDIKKKHGDHTMYSTCLYSGEKVYTANDAAVDGGTTVYREGGTIVGVSGSPMVPRQGTKSGDIDFVLLTDCKRIR